MLLPNIINISETIKKLWSAEEFGLKIPSGEINRKSTEQELSLHATHLLNLIYVLPNIIKLSQIVWELWPAQNFGFRGGKYTTKKVRVVSLVCDTLLVLLFIPPI